jgi:multiple sugar transport system permease protein
LIEDLAVSGPTSRRAIARYEFLLFVTPAVLFVTAFTAYPALSSTIISFTNINLGLTSWSFVGIDNYVRLLNWEFLPMVVRNTAILVACASLLQIAVGFVLATTLNQNLPFRRGVRSIAVLPWIVPAIVIGLLFQQMFNGSRLGIANTVLDIFGLPGRSWLTEPASAMVIMIATAVWRGVPLSTIILLGGLQTLPRDVYEAAAIDGATPMQSFRHVTLPLMRPILLVNLIWVTAGNLNQLDIPFALTGGAPAHQTEVLSETLYEQAFRLLDGGFAASIATVMLLINLVCTIGYLLLLRSQR